MLPSGGTDGWQEEVISTELLPPRNGLKDKFLGYSYLHTSDELHSITRLKNAIQIKDSENALVVQFDIPNAICVDIAFDQLDRYVAVWELADDQVWMNWFNPVSGVRESIQIATGNNPCCAMDERRDIFSSISDIFIVYQRGDEIFYRLQRDRYLVEYPVPHDQEGVILETCGMGTNLRFTIRTRSEDALVLMAGSRPVGADTDIVGLPWGVTPWDRN